MVYTYNNYPGVPKAIPVNIIRLTGLKEFGKYLNVLFSIDALFLNEDRHFHNIAVIRVILRHNTSDRGQRPI